MAWQQSRLLQHRDAVLHPLGGRQATRGFRAWGDEVGGNRANCAGIRCGDQWDYTAPAGSFDANRFGLYDVHGNMLEWVADCWNGNYEGAPAGGTARRGAERRETEGVSALLAPRRSLAAPAGSGEGEAPVMASPAPRTTLAAGTGVNRDVPRQDDVGRSRRITQLGVHPHAAMPRSVGGTMRGRRGPAHHPCTHHRGSPDHHERAREYARECPDGHRFATMTESHTEYG